MELFPAIDLRDGMAVRLTQGDFDRESSYGDPVELAERYVEGGAQWIHVVDLNAARTGVAHERGALTSIVALGTPVQTGGGIRTDADVDELLEAGVARVILGTAALEDPAFATRCALRWPYRVAVGLDYTGSEASLGVAQHHGWGSSSGRSLPSVLKHWIDQPLAAVVATSIARDGMLKGPDIEGMRSLLQITDLPVVASGGVGSLDDVRALAALAVDGRCLDGAIVGKALVEGRFSVAEAVAACAVSG
jgi:phosphoribosylformimino-5-aminoimidazole carboxamide ribotide isomerase